MPNLLSNQVSGKRQILREAAPISELSRVCVHSAIAQTSSVLRSQLLFGDQALWHPGAGRLTVDHTVEYLPQYGNHPDSVGFGVA
jgi:hypothetical protein